MRGIVFACAATAALLGCDRVVTVTPDGEVNTLEAAIEKVRLLRGRDPRWREAAAIELEDGVYLSGRAALLGAEDSNLVIRAKHRGKAVLSGALPLAWRRAGAETPSRDSQRKKDKKNEKVRNRVRRRRCCGNRRLQRP